MKIRILLSRLISTFLCAGYFPFVPGTFASLLGVLLFIPIKDNPAVYTAAAFLLVIAGFLASSEAEESFGKKDPKYIVIDEVAGMFISLLYFPYYDFQIVLMAFILFRIFDTLKAFPAGRIQYLKGSIGIMSDDLIAGIYSNIVIQVVFRCTSFKTS